MVSTSFSSCSPPPVIEFGVSPHSVCGPTFYEADRLEDGLIAQCLYWFRHKLLTACSAAAVVAMVIHSASASQSNAAQFGSVMPPRLAERFPMSEMSNLPK